MTRAQLTDVIDARLDALLAIIASKQAAFFAAHGRYWQGLATHDTLPADGAELPASQARAKAGGEVLSWADMGGLPAKTMSGLQTDTYDGPRGKGFVLSLSLTAAGETWRRCLNFGPETERGEPWTELAPLPKGLP